MNSPSYGEGIAAKYAFEVATDAKYTITKRALTITAPVLTKVYDGGTGIGASTIASGGEVSGEAGAESFTLTVSGGTYPQSDVGSNLAISSASFGLMAGQRGEQEDELQLHAACGGNGIDHGEGSDGGGRGADEGLRRRHGDQRGDAERRRGEWRGEQPEA